MSNSKNKRFSCFVVKIKTKDGRAIGDDPAAIVDAMQDTWDELTEKLTAEE